MSAPAQKLSPSPESRTTRASPTSSNASCSSAISSASKALRRSGFASVTRRIGPSRSTRSPPSGRTLKSRPCSEDRLPRRSRRFATAAPRSTRTPSGPYVDFLAAPGRLDGVLALGTTGEGILLSVDERKRVGRAVRRGAAGRLQVAIHAGAQTTADTVELAAHAADARRRRGRGHRPAVLHLRRGGALPAFRRGRGGERPAALLPLRVQGPGRLFDPAARGRAARRPGGWAQGLEPAVRAVEPYLLEGLDVFIGAESLVDAGVERGAAGSVSGLAAAFPEGADAGRSVRFLERFPFQAALKTVIALRGFPFAKTCVRRYGV